jgi:hypothetical protein
MVIAEGRDVKLRQEASDNNQLSPTKRSLLLPSVYLIRQVGSMCQHGGMGNVEMA